MSQLLLPENYRPMLDLKQTEQGIKHIKDFFQQSLSSSLRLRRVTAPLFILGGTGVNDDLSGWEKPVSFNIRDLQGQRAEIVHSLAKWKRLMLAEYQIERGYGLYTDMNAIRPDEELDNLHSLYVDQWDWEATVAAEDRQLDFLQDVVRRIYAVLRQTEYAVFEQFPCLKPTLPADITFIHAEELRQRYPDLTPKERENKICAQYGAVFVIGIGCELGDGKKHDMRAPDYDDYTTVAANGLPGLNGDILLWNQVLGQAFELSSMGIRVDKEAMLRQLALSGCESRKELYFHRRLLNDELPLSIGGGIGQSRLCMLLLRKGHIGEIQASIWPEDMRRTCLEHGMHLI